jgi:hypothetical protein
LLQRIRTFRALIRGCPQLSVDEQLVSQDFRARLRLLLAKAMHAE